MRADIVSEALQKHRGNIESNSVQSFVQALRAAPDSCAEEFMTLRAKSKLLTFFLSLVCGVFAIDRFYLGDKKSAITKVVLIFASATLCLIPFIFYWTMGAMGLSGILLYVGLMVGVVAAVMYIGDVFTLSRKVKDYNYKYLAGFLHDATGEAKLAASAALKTETEAEQTVAAEPEAVAKSETAEELAPAADNA